MTSIVQKVEKTFLVFFVQLYTRLCSYAVMNVLLRTLCYEVSNGEELNDK